MHATNIIIVNYKSIKSIQTYKVSYIKVVIPKSGNIQNINKTTKLLLQEMSKKYYDLSLLIFYLGLLKIYRKQFLINLQILF